MTETDPTTSAAPASLADALAGRTFAAEAGIDLRDAPAPLFRLLVLACLLAAPVQHTTAIRAALALRPLTRTAKALAEADPDDVSRALTTAGYWRFHHTKAALLVRAATDVVDRCGGDLRRLYREADSAGSLHRTLRRIPGVGAQAAHIVMREAQGVWPDLQPYLDARVLDGAARLGLPTEPGELAALVDPVDLPRLAAGCVRATLMGAIATGRPASGASELDAE
jgi:hypothetical protein